jgi:predicted transposase/invertase (TIGR01784 family)
MVQIKQDPHTPRIREVLPAEAQSARSAASKLSPHDRFCRGMLSNLTIAKAFFEAFLPEPVKQRLDLSNLRQEKDSFIDDYLRQKTPDLLYTAPYKHTEGFLYLLLEHASTPEERLPFRMLSYCMTVVQSHLKQSKKSPLVYPSIFYTGKKFTPTLPIF